jgi:hypothetical protein
MKAAAVGIKLRPFVKGAKAIPILAVIALTIPLAIKSPSPTPYSPLKSREKSVLSATA